MKTLFALFLGFAVYVALGAMVNFTNNTAVVVTLLGSFGAFTYKGIIAVVTFGAVCKS